MPLHENSLLDLTAYNSTKVENLFSKAKKLKSEKNADIGKGETVALLFFEPSTRTRISFQSAAIRCGLGPIIFDGGISSSLEKGETIEDSILNVAAMMPKAVVVRCGDSEDLNKIAEKIPMPLINAGWGMRGHPTQALLDLFTIQDTVQNLQNLKILIVGDVKHSRVAASHFELLPTMGCQVAICGPDRFLIKKNNVKVFSNLDEALRWADVVITLRVQFERHSDRTENVLEYKSKYSLSRDSLKNFKADGIIMHPGPINHGIEIETEVLSDPRCQILKQVTHGVFLRQALLRECLNAE